jgi:peroxin-1
VAQILSKIIEERLNIAANIITDPQSPLNLAYLATQTEGYAATDLQDLVALAIHQVASRNAMHSVPVSLLQTETVSSLMYNSPF